jgi:Tol biopolymer transport system component
MSNFSNKLLLASLLAFARLICAAPSDDTANVLMQAAMKKELVDGDLNGAIKQYAAIVAKYKNDRAVTAMALVHMAECHQKMGDAESRKIYEQVVREYGDQKEAVTLARARLGTGGTAAVNGAVSRQIWSGPMADNMGTPSPDGRLLSFTDWETGDLAIRDVAAASNRRLTSQSSPYSDGYAFKSRVSPDGKYVAFGWQKSNGVDLRLIGIDGAGLRVLYANPEIEYIEPAGWSPDGKRILAKLNSRSRTVRIAWIPVANGPEATLKTLPWGSLGYVSLSPDGSHVAYDFRPKEDSPNRNIMLLSSDGSRETALSENAAGEEVFGWSPDGKMLLFKSNRSGAPDLWAFRLTGGKVEVPPALVRRDVGGRVEPMGVTNRGSLYYSLKTSTSDVYTATWDWVLGKEGGEPKIAGHRLLGVNRSPDWSPDGKYLAYTSQPGSRDSAIITILSLETGEERQLSSKTITPWQGTLWSLDGRSLMVVGFDQKKRRGVYAVDVLSGDATVLVQDQTGQTIFNPEWLPGGKSIVYYRRDTDNTGTTSHLVVKDLQSGIERELRSGSEKGGYLYTSVSPDGQFLAFLSGGNGSTGALKVTPIRGGDPRDLDTFDKTSTVHRLLGWTPDSRQVILASFHRVGDRISGRELWAIPVGGGEPHRLPALDGEPPFRFHPNGQQVAFQSSRNGLEIWAMENFLTTPTNSK